MRDKITKLILVIVIFIAVIGGILVVIKYQADVFLKNLAKNLSTELGTPVFIEKVNYKWVGYDIEVEIDNFIVRDHDTKAPIFMLGRLYGTLSLIDSVLKLNVCFKDLTIDSLKIKLGVHNYTDIRLLGLLGQPLAPKTSNNNPIIKLIFGQQLLTIRNADIVFAGYNQEVALNFPQAQIIKNERKSVFKMSGKIIESPNTHYVITGEYIDDANIEANAQINNLSLDKINDLLPENLRILGGNIAQTTINMQMRNNKVDVLNLMTNLDNMLVDKNYNIAQGHLQLLYRRDLGTGRFSVNDFKMFDKRKPTNSLNIADMSADLIVENNHISASNLQAKINDFNALIKLEIGKNKSDWELACLADFEGLKIDYVKQWLNNDYIPESIVDWINSAITGGNITHFYAQYDNSEHTLQVDFAEANLQYTPKWPVINNLNTTLAYHNNVLSLENSSGIMLDIPVFVSKAVFSDIGQNKFAHLTINGSSEASIEKAIDFLMHTPLKEQVTKPVQTFAPEGNLTLNLNLDLLFHENSPKILMNGLAKVFNGVINVPNVPSKVDNIVGEFEFSNSSLISHDLSFNLLGNAADAKIVFDHDVSDKFVFELDTNFDFNNIKDLLASYKIDEFTGVAYLQARFETSVDQQKNSTLVIKSNLKGAQSTYPYPLSKNLDEELPLVLTYKFSPNVQGVIQTAVRGYDFSYDFDNKIFGFAHSAIKGELAFNEKINKYKINVEYIDVDALLSENKSSKPMSLDNFKKAKPIILEAEVKKIIYNKYPIENFSFQLLPRSYGYQIVDLSINNQNMHLQAQGQWQIKGSEFTQFSGNIYSENFSKILEIFDSNSSISKCNGEVNFSLESPGDITKIKKENFEGVVKVAFNDGVINGVKPGFGKILGLISLEGIQRRLQLDFSDLTTQGLAFDRLTADYHINKTIVTTKDLNIQAPSAQIAIAGDIHIDTKKIDLSMLIVPRVGAGIPVAAAIATGNPAIGAAIWLFDKAAGLQIMDFAQFNYKVTGTFEKPIVTEIDPSKTGSKS